MSDDPQSRVMTSRFNGRCQICRRVLLPGNLFRWFYPVNGHRAYSMCLDCYNRKNSFNLGPHVPIIPGLSSVSDELKVERVQPPPIINTPTSSRVRHDIITGQLLWEEQAGKFEIFEPAKLIAQKFLGLWLTGNVRRMLDVGAGMGCEGCIALNNSADIAEHFTTVEHLSKILQMPKNQTLIVRLLDEASEKCIVEPEIHVESNPLEPVAQGFRGFKSYGSGGRFRLVGAKNNTWFKSSYKADCSGNRERCLTHIRNGGFDTLGGVLVLPRGSDRIDISLRERNSSPCLCGLYGFLSMEEMIKQISGFDVVTWCFGWGTVSWAEDGWRASDAKIARAWIVKDLFSKARTSSIDVGLPGWVLLDENERLMVRNLTDQLKEVVWNSLIKNFEAYYPEVRFEFVENLEHLRGIMKWEELTRQANEQLTSKGKVEIDLSFRMRTDNDQS